MRLQNKVLITTVAVITLVIILSQIIFARKISTENAGSPAPVPTAMPTPSASTQASTPSISPRKIQDFPSLPTVYRETHFAEIQKGIDERMNLFLKGKHFRHWQANRPKNEIIEEFQQLKDWRSHTWYSDIAPKTLISRPDFMLAQSLLEKGYFRSPHVLAFDYNKTDNTYNSSSIIINGQRFLALEAPTQKLATNFLRLLQNYRVTQLVRLTPEKEDIHLKCYPYWKNNLRVDLKTNKLFLSLPSKTALKSDGKAEKFDMHYYALENWPDHQGINPKILLDLILTVREDYNPKDGLLACHCCGGVGRTGTFIAGFLLLQEIDRQLANGTALNALDISVEKVVMQLSLQRFHMVAKPEQYVTLYRLVDLYTQNLAKKQAA